jgi:hypothetical protein
VKFVPQTLPEAREAGRLQPASADGARLLGLSVCLYETCRFGRPLRWQPKFLQIIRNHYAAPDFALSNSNANPSYLSLLQTNRAAPPWLASCRSNIMQDLIWIGIILALLAASLGYARLCDDA